MACSLARISVRAVAPHPHLGSRLCAPRSVAMSRLLDRLSTRRKLFDSTSKQAIHVVRGVSLLTRVRFRLSFFVAACHAAQHLAPDRVLSAIKAIRMLFAQLTAKCSDAERSKIILENFPGRSPKTKTPLVGAAFTFSMSVTASPQLTPSP